MKNKGFSLAEVMAAVLISSMVLIAALTVYSRAQKASVAVLEKIEKPRLSQEILQRIAEDLDGIISDGSETTIAIQNGRTNGYASARLTITKMIYTENNQKKLYEQVIWAAALDPESTSDRLILYRSHKGIALEDKLLEDSADPAQREQFVPICEGLTYFGLFIPQDEELLSTWTGQALPKSVIASLSFAEPVENSDGTRDVYEEDIILRTIAIDRTRKIKFEIPEYLSTISEQTDSNEPDPNAVDSSTIDPNETR